MTIISRIANLVQLSPYQPSGRPSFRTVNHLSGGPPKTIGGD
jgi:hypothetical protein